MRQWTPLALNVPASTAQAAPVTQTWTLYPGWVHAFRIDIPAGHRGLTGVRLVYMGTPIIPFHATQFLVGNGQNFTVPFDDQVMNRGLVAEAFNTDVWPHTFYLWADVDPHLPGSHVAVGGRKPGQLAAAAIPPGIAALTSSGGAG